VAQEPRADLSGAADDHRAHRMSPEIWSSISP
jgi:hypothetical protein